MGRFLRPKRIPAQRRRVAVQRAQRHPIEVHQPQASDPAAHQRVGAVTADPAKAHHHHRRPIHHGMAPTLNDILILLLHLDSNCPAGYLLIWKPQPHLFWALLHHCLGQSGSFRSHCALTEERRAREIDALGCELPHPWSTYGNLRGGVLRSCGNKSPRLSVRECLDPSFMDKHAAISRPPASRSLFRENRKAKIHNLEGVPVSS